MSRRAQVEPAGRGGAQPVLLVEDSADAVAAILDALDRGGLRNPVVIAASLAEARAALLRGAGDPSTAPVLVLLDLELPDGNGLELLAELAAAGAPIVVLTGLTDPRGIDEAHRLGASAYLVKPLAYEALIDVVRDLRVPWALLPSDDRR